MLASPVVLSILIIIGFAPITLPTGKVNSRVQDQPPTCIGGKDGVNADLFNAGKEAAKRIVQAYSAGKEFDAGDVRLVNASKAACAAADVRQAAAGMISSNDKTIKQELLETARDNGARILTRYNSSNRDVTFSGSELRDLETFQNVMLAVACLRHPAPSAPPGTTGSAPGAEERVAARRVVEAFNQSGSDVDFKADDKAKLKNCRKPR